MEDDLKKNENGRQPNKNRMENEPINLIGCDTTVNSPSAVLLLLYKYSINSVTEMVLNMFRVKYIIHKVLSCVGIRSGLMMTDTSTMPKFINKQASGKNVYKSYT